MLYEKRLEPGSNYKANENECQIGQLMSQDSYIIAVGDDMIDLRKLSNCIQLGILPNSVPSSYNSTQFVYSNVNMLTLSTRLAYRDLFLTVTDNQVFASAKQAPRF